MNIYLDYWKKGLDFKGSAVRSEFWIPSSINAAIIYTLFVYVIYNSSNGFMFMVFALFWLANLVPQCAAMIRRFRDTERSVWYWLWGFIPFIGPIIVIYALAQEE